MEKSKGWHVTSHKSFHHMDPEDRKRIRQLTVKEGVSERGFTAWARRHKHAGDHIHMHVLRDPKGKIHAWSAVGKEYHIDNKPKYTRKGPSHKHIMSYTHSALRGKGVGKTLFKRAITAAKRQGATHIHVQPLKGHKESEGFMKQNKQHTERHGIAYDKGIHLTKASLEDTMSQQDQQNEELAFAGTGGEGTVTTKGDEVGQIMNGRQFVGTLFDSEFNEIQVWYQPANNQYFRGASVTQIGDRTIAYGQWKYLTTSGKYHVAKLRAFMDRMLPEDKRTPEYHTLRMELPLNQMIKSREDATVSAGPFSNALEGGTLGMIPNRADGTGGTPGKLGNIVQNRRRWSDEAAKEANQLIADLWVQLLGAGFSKNEFSQNWYTDWFQKYDIRLNGTVLYQQSISQVRNYAIIEESLDCIDWELSRFEPEPFQFPGNLNGTPVWTAVAKLNTGNKLVFKLDYSKSELKFILT